MTIDQQSSNIYFSKFNEHILSSYFCDIHLINTSNELSRQFKTYLVKNCPEYILYVVDKTIKSLVKSNPVIILEMK